MAEAGSWCTIESDPGVFTELIEEIGVRGLEVQELWSLDDLQVHPSRVHGLIFLFKWVREEDARPVVPWDAVDVFFAKQIVNNACATQAILSVLLNAQDIELGNELELFRDFTKALNPELKGLSISNSDVIRTAHNSFSPQHGFSLEEMGMKDDDDVYHFISYVPVGGHLYELDGLKQGPIDLGECSEGDWKQKASEVISQRIQRYSAAEIRFNLLCVVDSPLAKLNATLKELSEKDPNDEEVAAQLELAKAEIAAEEEKRRAWKEENVRRKHNYVPFVINLLKVLAEKNKLQGLVDKAVEEKAQKKAKSGK